MKKPVRLYKYQPVTARTLENLKLRTIWFSTPSAFNDPFDCAVDVALKDLDEEDVVRAYEYLRRKAKLFPQLLAGVTPDGKPDDSFRTTIIDVARNSVPELIDATRRRVGVACFSAKNDDLLMWAHYADGHRGFCLEFDTSVDPFTRAKPVVYQDSIPEVNPLDILDGRRTAKDIIEAMVFTKHTSWQYEQEWRLIHQQLGTAYHCPYVALTGVYLGASMSSGQKDMIGQLLYDSPVQLHVMQRVPGTFSLQSSPVTYTPYQFPGKGGEKRPLTRSDL